MHAFSIVPRHKYCLQPLIAYRLYQSYNTICTDDTPTLVEADLFEYVKAQLSSQEHSDQNSRQPFHRLQDNANKANVIARPWVHC